MGTIGIRDLSRNTSKVIDEVSSTGRPVIVTKNGRPVAAVIGVDVERMEDFVLANAPEYVSAIVEAEADHAADRVRDASEVFDELEQSQSNTG